ncbi:ditrans polycis-undecaprenyl-diphosphate synthase ((2E 6E)-farnesyl-diphosphate specific) [endosymbiont of Sipalinus gigas]|uniref:isoprenyl transferase n=1 Tax=endosymbiont of Sipalinus gigas TaxID=1972134 RepID=UPI000DC6EFEE|nr:isoprenyl transferase [endosymbiont of Sipalinus gigas]BBA85297.1 ditrans polycis-undecaprenyl-diphosphate synthase ((2E 6E)-farnesyl-diphosphate specific) [endosymbiont of Sipalinus gigas]
MIDNLPDHVAIIMDGNGRWAKKIGKPRIFGHKHGIKSIYKIIKSAINFNLKVLTLYAFSSENWSRPKKEIDFIMNIFTKILKKEIKNLNNQNIKINIIGDKNKLNNKLKSCIEKIEETTKNNNKLILNIAINYGGKWDILQALKKIINNVIIGKIKVENISESTIDNYICINNFPKVDLLIRTGGEKRISNFLLWQIAYSEFYFTKILWPDFNEIEFKKSLISFSKRDRKFGCIKI